jgi:BioD-like phosphotransacetylase family protein
MKSIYITSTEPYSGKSAVCLALGKKLQAKGVKIGYLKPMSTQPWRTPEGQLADEDAGFFCKMLGLKEHPTQLSPVVITQSILQRRLKGIGTEDLLEKIIQSTKEIGKDKDVLILEGGASLREGYAMGINNLMIAQAVGAPVLVMIRYHRKMQIIDDTLTAQLRLGDQFLGVILNHVPEEAFDYINEYAKPFIEEQGISVLGCLPSKPRLSALSVGELIELLDAEVLTEHLDPNALAEAFTVGAMTVDAALSRFRRQQNKAVITGGDRADIQLAALETSTVVLILTGYLHPSPVVLHQADSLGVPVLLVKENTMQTVESIERAYGKTRLGQPEKLDTFIQLLRENIALDKIYQVLDLKKT